MSFETVMIISAIGIAITVLVIVAVGWSKKTKIETLESASTRFLEDFPDCIVLNGIISSNLETALLAIESKESAALGLVTVFGDKLVTRKIDASSGAVLDITETGLQLIQNDITFPKLTIPLSHFDAQTWQSSFSAMEAKA